MTIQALKLILGLGILCASLMAEAQEKANLRRIGVLCPPGSSYVEALEDGLQGVGWTRDRHYVLVEQRGCTKERLRETTADLVRQDVAIIVTGPSPYVAAVKEVAPTTPIVMVYGSDAIELGHIASLARPGGNITGLTWDPTPEIFGKHVELLLELHPPPSRLAGIVDPQVQYRHFWKEAELAANRRSVPLQYVEVRIPADVAKAFAAITRERAGGVIIFGGPFLYGLQSQLFEHARTNRLPTASMYREGAEAGGLISYGPSLRELWRRAGSYVDRILKGAKPADLPVEQPTKFELVINLKTAKALGLTIPQSLLQRADQVIE